MATLPVQGAVIPGAAVTMATPAGTSVGSDVVPIGAPGLALLIQNTSGASRSVLIGTPTALDRYGIATANITETLAANGLRLVRLPNDLAEPSGLIQLGCDNTAGLTYAAIATG
jgi:hypothetical protein